MLLGTRLYYPFYESEHDAMTFEQKVDRLVREIGDRGQHKPRLMATSSLASGLPEAVPPAPTPTPAPARQTGVTHVFLCVPCLPVPLVYCESEGD